MGLAKYSITLGVARSEVVVNDQDVSSIVSGVRVEHSASPDALPVVTLRGIGDIAIEGEGVVYVQPDTRAEGTSAEEFLTAIDAEELDKEALEGMGLGDKGGAAAYLDVLKRWARGDS